MKFKTVKWNLKPNIDSAAYSGAGGPISRLVHYAFERYRAGLMDM